MTTATRLPTTPATPLEGDWRVYASCATADPELFFPIGEGAAAQAQAEDAKRVCARCPVRERCLDWALDTGQTTGVWGGLAEQERRGMRRSKPVETALDRCVRRRSWIERQLAAGVPKKTIAGQIGVDAVVMTRATRLFDAQRTAEASEVNA